VFGRQGLPDRFQIIAGIKTVRDFADVFAERLAVTQESELLKGALKYWSAP
jgi:hypothetical protein